MTPVKYEIDVITSTGEPNVVRRLGRAVVEKALGPEAWVARFESERDRLAFDTAQEARAALVADLRAAADAIEAS